MSDKMAELEKAIAELKRKLRALGVRDDFIYSPKRPLIVVHIGSSGSIE